MFLDNYWVKRENYNKGKMLPSQEELFAQKFEDYDKAFANMRKHMEVWVLSKAANIKRNSKSKDAR